MSPRSPGDRLRLVQRIIRARGETQRRNDAANAVADRVGEAANEEQRLLRLETLKPFEADVCLAEEKELHVLREFFEDWCQRSEVDPDMGEDDLERRLEQTRRIGAAVH